MTTQEFDGWLEERGRIWSHFDPSALSRKFVKYFRSGQRIKVNDCGHVVTGTVGVTTGFKPCFLLMRRSNAISSSWTLSEHDEIVAEQVGGKYVAVSY